MDVVRGAEEGWLDHGCFRRIAGEYYCKPAGAQLSLQPDYGFLALTSQIPAPSGTEAPR
jgi:hypothetical protein